MNNWKQIFSVTSVTVLASLMFFLPLSVTAGTFKDYVSAAMKTFNVKSTDCRLLVITNAPYIKANAQIDSLAYLEKIQQSTGCTVGKGNLLFYQSSQKQTLRIMLYKKCIGLAVVISFINNEVYSENIPISIESVCKESFWKGIKRYKCAEDLFTLVGLATAWMKNVPNDFLKCAEIHNHICPMLVNGYIMGHYIMDKHPLKEGEEYSLLIYPEQIEEEAFLVVLETLTGRRTLFRKESLKQKEECKLNYSGGLLFIWNHKTETGTCVVLNFDYDKLKRSLANRTPMIGEVVAAFAYIEKPEYLISTAAEFVFNKATYRDILNEEYSSLFRPID